MDARFDGPYHMEYSEINVFFKKVQEVTYYLCTRLTHHQSIKYCTVLLQLYFIIDVAPDEYFTNFYFNLQQNCNRFPATDFML